MAWLQSNNENPGMATTENDRQVTRTKRLISKFYMIILGHFDDSDFISLSFKQFDVKKDQYFKNIMQSYAYFNLKNYAKLGKPVDKER